MTATIPTRPRQERWGNEAPAPPPRGVITHALGVSLALHGACAAILVLLAARIERSHFIHRPDYIKISILPEVVPTPEPPALATSPPQETQIAQHHVKHRQVPVEVKPPDEPAPESTPGVSVVPDATSSTGAIPAPVGSGEGMGDVSEGEGDSSGDDDSGAPVAASAVARPPEIETYVVPEYPRMARARGIQGRVRLMVVVDESGKVEDDIKILDSIPMLDQAAIDAVHQWSFTPGRDADGNPVRVQLEVPVRFTLR